MGWFSRRYYRLWFFFEKFTRGPLQGGVKKSNSMRSCFYSLLISQIEFYYLLSGMKIYFHDKNAISLNLVFWPHPEGDHGWIFRKKIKVDNNAWKIIPFYLVFWADSEYPIKFNERTNSYYQNRWSTRQKPSKSGLLISILRISISYLCFFLDIFIPFCSLSKGVSNDIKFHLDRL
jgi:hypothetical protein